MATLLGSESQQHTGRKRRNSSGNIVAKFAAVRITGKGFSRGTQVRENAVVLRDKRRRRVARSRPGSRAAAQAERGDASPGHRAGGDAVALSLPPRLRLQKANGYIYSAQQRQGKNPGAQPRWASCPKRVICVVPF